ncbi:MULTISPECIES: site-specific DNA-methyltransferase [Bacillus cereus group]|uniref:site-specific DNA-methyltransferase n=1 Tax=Bacillus cereus group TaxID=86661 RepID=UPI002647AF0A|nr:MULTISPECIES: site-specific DNA-methyltransferase [Bacillus cereus group]MDX5810226.1 site-specific DNA-methyltransferase [Bacillus cereus group sp. BfR-BA-02730]WKD20775.1 site-specific DNA-methyltransferase [Bacillus paranthracis]
MENNISKKKRMQLLDKVYTIKEAIEQENVEDNRYDLIKQLNEIENELNTKKFGLVYEEHEENVDRKLKTHLPILVEEKKLSVENSGEINFLIEGDNLASLNLLTKTHLGNIDFIYIDPPYNTGNKDFKYDDSFVNKEDSFKHSKWLSFMEKRLVLAKKLLSKDGFIAISIDEIEFHVLKLLCDDIFGDNNYIGEFIWKARSGKGGTDTFISMQHEYILCYAKDKSEVNFRADIKLTTKEQKEQLRQWGQGVYRKDRPTMFFPILYKSGEFKLPTVEECVEIYRNGEFNDVYLDSLKTKYINEGYEVVLPYIENEYGRWRKGYTGVQELIDQKLLWIEGTEENRVIKKLIPSGQESKMAVDSLLLNLGSASKGTAEIKELFNNKKVFDTTKPVEVVKYLINLATYNKQSAIILDFFAGSGTTGDAVLQLNKELNKNLQFILCTNNESNICRDVTYQRILKKINGYSYKGKKTEILYEKKLNLTLLKQSGKILEEIDKIKQEYKGKFDKIETRIEENVIKVIATKKVDGAIEGLGGSLKYFVVDYILTSNQFYYEYADSLLNNIKELVELENGINLNMNDEISIILNDEELEGFFGDLDSKSRLKIVYLGHDVLTSAEQEDYFTQHNILVKIIPNYYYNELRG